MIGVVFIPIFNSNIKVINRAGDRTEMYYDGQIETDNNISNSFGDEGSLMVIVRKSDDTQVTYEIEGTHVITPLEDGNILQTFVPSRD